MTPPSPAPRPSAGRVPLSRLGGLLSSVTFGIVLLALLFLYCTIGSAGLAYPVGFNIMDSSNWVYTQLRELRPFEMTEFEWFHWWPFDVLVGLICVVMATVTVRRIKLNATNAGVWMIHSGIITLCIGSVIYYGTKLEGDVAVARREVAIRLPSGEQGQLTAVPGTSLFLGGARDPWRFQVRACDPEWELLSGDDKGTKVFQVSVLVSHGDEQFMRQLHAGYPQYTEDVVFSDDPSRPMARAVKELGRPLVDEQLELSLQYQPQDQFYLANWVQKSWALYLREVKPDGTTTEWVERPVEGLPLWNDYVRSAEEVWLPADGSVPIDPVDVLVPSVQADDPLAGVPLRITNYLRYAQMETRRIEGGPTLNPVASVLLDDGRGRRQVEELEALSPTRRTTAQGTVGLSWADSLEQRAALATGRPGRLSFHVPGSEIKLEHEISEVSLRDDQAPFLPIEGTDYEYRVEFMEDLRGAGVDASMASVELRTPEREFRRWVFDKPELNKDVSPSAPDDGDGGSANRLIPEAVYPTDPGLHVTFMPGVTPEPLLLVAGPGEDELGMVLHVGGEQDGQYVPIALGERISMGRGETLAITSFHARSRSETRPRVVPRAERIPDMRHQLSMVRLDFAQGERSHAPWVAYNHYPLDGPNHTLRRFAYKPAQVQLSDGRVVQMVLSRQREPLPSPVVLDDFLITPHVGGFDGRVSSILNWTSRVRFVDSDQQLTEPMTVSVNEPAEHGGLSFFQAQWDPPDPARGPGDVPSKGLNYTVLGVGNRNGVLIQLLGCTIAVLGMLYAFFVKPYLRRRRRRSALAGEARPARPSLQPVSLAMEESR